MILVGRYLSPFTRRAAIVLKTLNIGFEVKHLTATPENAELVAINPLARVPALILIVTLFFIGFFPKTVTESLNDALEREPVYAQGEE